ncbi:MULTISPECIES: hypothetical protein [unclassified Aureimonas]|uniref:hypothetical protein n=1 Tax=unclassified Aureimonas TaxID=2615206 RepID=UPI0006FFDD61|nr:MULTISPECIES: hypothetical protein [unclassified Aureimonas]KQT66099.1 hypothetical protein ASG62_20010 [Aureimonas sp. Leaf427]KQT81037.1 hypothetical protein ASG54_06240 [Aureimonas sp. Leaf460]
MPQQRSTFDDILIQTEERAARAPLAKRKWLTFDNVFISFSISFSIGFLVFAYCVSLIDPEYFNRRVLATMRPAEVDTVRTGSVEAEQALMASAMPAPRIVRARDPVPADYQIITVFDREAILATEDELMRVKVGSVAPGLGQILAIDQTEKGLVVRTAEATLRSDEN